MGNKKQLAAEARKEARSNQYFARLVNIPSSPRKMRLVADMVRGMEVSKALGVLKYSSRNAAKDVAQLLKSAVSNWEQKKGRTAEEGELFITKIFVDEGVTLKRLRPRAQGRGTRIRKRSNHLTIYVDTLEGDN